MNRFVVNLFGQRNSGSKFQHGPFVDRFVGVDGELDVVVVDFVTVDIVDVVVVVAVAVVVVTAVVSRLIRVDWNCFF